MRSEPSLLVVRQLFKIIRITYISFNLIMSMSSLFRKRLHFFTRQAWTRAYQPEKIKPLKQHQTWQQSTGGSLSKKKINKRTVELLQQASDSK